MMTIARIAGPLIHNVASIAMVVWFVWAMVAGGNAGRARTIDASRNTC